MEHLAPTPLGESVTCRGRIINVDGLQVKAVRNEANRTIRATFTATTFVYEEGPDAMEASQ